MVRLIVEGRAIAAPATHSILQAFVQAGETLVEGVGCMGQGVCGSCRVMVRRDGGPSKGGPGNNSIAMRPHGHLPASSRSLQRRSTRRND